MIRFPLGISHARGRTVFTVTAPATINFNVGFKFQVQAKDDLGNNQPGYTGTAHFTTSGGGPVISGDAALVAGFGEFDCKFTAGGDWTITATDIADPNIIGTSGTIHTTIITPGSVVFSASQAWVVPANFNSARNTFEMYGGGGGGGFGGGDAGSGGGGGGYSRYDNWTSVLPGQTYNVAVGAAGGGNGGAGGQSGIHSSGTWNLWATGGSGGGGSSAPGIGGSGATGNTQNFTGGNGTTGFESAFLTPGATGGPGGGCAGPGGNGFTAGRYDPNGGAPNGGYAGQGGDTWGVGSGTGRPYGGGGGGGAYSGGGADPNGGAGAQGLVIITWYAA